MKERQHSLAARLRAGDRLAATELVDLYYEKIYVFMRRLGHDRQVSEDLTQESFLNAWRHIGQLRDGKALNSWLYRIAINLSKLYWRKHKGATVVDVEKMGFPDRVEAGSDRAIHDEQLERLSGAVAGLPLKLRQVIILHYMEQMTISEAAVALDIRQGTFKSRLNRALGILRERMS